VVSIVDGSEIGFIVSLTRVSINFRRIDRRYIIRSDAYDRPGDCAKGRRGEGEGVAMRAISAIARISGFGLIALAVTGCVQNRYSRVENPPLASEQTARPRKFPFLISGTGNEIKFDNPNQWPNRPPEEVVQSRFVQLFPNLSSRVSSRRSNPVSFGASQASASIEPPELTADAGNSGGGTKNSAEETFVAEHPPVDSQIDVSTERSETEGMSEAAESAPVAAVSSPATIDWARLSANSAGAASVAATLAAVVDSGEAIETPEPPGRSESAVSDDLPTHSEQQVAVDPRGNSATAKVEEAEVAVSPHVTPLPAADQSAPAVVAAAPVRVEEQLAARQPVASLPGETPQAASQPVIRPEPAPAVVAASEPATMIEPPAIPASEAVATNSESTIPITAAAERTQSASSQLLPASVSESRPAADPEPPVRIAQVPPVTARPERSLVIDPAQAESVAPPVQASQATPLATSAPIVPAVESPMSSPEVPAIGSIISRPEPTVPSIAEPKPAEAPAASVVTNANPAPPAIPSIPDVPSIPVSEPASSAPVAAQVVESASPSVVPADMSRERQALAIPGLPAEVPAVPEANAPQVIAPVQANPVTSDAGVGTSGFGTKPTASQVPAPAALPDTLSEPPPPQPAPELKIPGISDVPAAEDLAKAQAGGVSLSDSGIERSSGSNLNSPAPALVDVPDIRSEKIVPNDGTSVEESPSSESSEASSMQDTIPVLQPLPDDETSANFDEPGKTFERKPGELVIRLKLANPFKLSRYRQPRSDQQENVANVRSLKSAAKSLFVWQRDKNKMAEPSQAVVEPEQQNVEIANEVESAVPTESRPVTTISDEKSDQVVKTSGESSDTVTGSVETVQASVDPVQNPTGSEVASETATPEAVQPETNRSRALAYFVPGRTQRSSNLARMSNGLPAVEFPATYHAARPKSSNPWYAHANPAVNHVADPRSGELAATVYPLRPANATATVREESRPSIRPDLEVVRTSMSVPSSLSNLSSESSATDSTKPNSERWWSKGSKGLRSLFMGEEEVVPSKRPNWAARSTGRIVEQP
jgi:hypothetical protein